MTDLWRQLRTAGRPRWEPQRSGRRLQMTANGETKIPAIKVITKQHDVTVNDLLVAATVDSLDGIKPNWTTPKRPNLLVQVPVSTRNSENRFEFGQHLGIWTLSVPAGSMTERLRAIRTLTIDAKSGPHARQGAALVGAAERLLRIFPRSPMTQIGRWAVPIAGFISNLNLTSYFRAETEQGLLKQFTRAVSPCDYSPVVLTATGIGTELNIRATAWDAYLNQWELQQLVNGISKRIASLAVIPETQHLRIAG